MTDAPDLLPCPFCGSDASHSWSNGGEYVGYAESHTIKCKGCGNCFSRMDDQNPNGGYAISGTALPKVVRLWNTRARPMTVAEAAKVLLDNTPNPTFDILKYPMIGEFKQSIAMQDEDGEEVWRDVTIEWTTIKEIFAAGLRALSQGGE